MTAIRWQRFGINRRERKIAKQNDSEIRVAIGNDKVNADPEEGRVSVSQKWTQGGFENKPSGIAAKASEWNDAALLRSAMSAAQAALWPNSGARVRH